MRVLIVSTSYPPFVIGGAERSVQELARGLAGSGHEVRVVCLGPESAGNTTELDGGVTVKRLASSGFRPFAADGKNETRLGKAKWHVQEFARLSTYRSLVGEIREFKPSVVHTNNLAGFGWLAWKAAGRTPLVHTMRDYYLSCMASTHWRNGHQCPPDYLPCRLSKLPFRLSHRRPDLFVGISNDIVAQHRGYGSITPAETTVTIYNNPDVNVVSSRTTARSASEPFWFGALGRVGDDKGTWKVIEAFRKLPEKVSGRSVRLKVAGSGTQDDLAQLASAVEMDPRISYVGTMSPSSFYAAVDCALVATQWAEPFGRTAAEALVSGVSLLASRVGGLPEVVEIYGGSSRLVAEYTDAAAWSIEMERLVTDPPPTIPPSHRRATTPVHAQYLLAYESVARGRAAFGLNGVES
jgi:glycosyltransferase involved in cell wall biosynthesis